MVWLAEKRPIASDYIFDYGMQGNDSYKRLTCVYRRDITKVDMGCSDILFD